MSEVIYELKEPFKYAKGGEQEEAAFITLTAPTFKQLDKYSPIKQCFTAAIAEITESISTESTPEESGKAETENTIDAAAVLATMYRWSGDMTKVFLHAEQLFKSGAALVDGESKLTTPLMEKMAMSDFEGLVGTYISNFIAPSLMDGQEKNTD